MARKIEKWLAEENIEINCDGSKAEVIIALGGDGTILRRHANLKLKIRLLLDLIGQCGFLASVRKEKIFCRRLDVF